MSVPKEQISIPKFKTEAEETAWWDSHAEAATEIMRRALKSGTVRRRFPLKIVTMRLPLADLEIAQDLASKKGAASSIATPLPLYNLPPMRSYARFQERFR